MDGTIKREGVRPDVSLVEQAAIQRNREIAAQHAAEERTHRIGALTKLLAELEAAPMRDEARITGVRANLEKLKKA